MLYIVAGLPLAALALVVAAPLLLGAPLIVTFVGLPLVAVTLLGARRLASIQRELAAVLILERVEAPRPVHGGPGFQGWLDSTVRDAASWRAVGYFAMKVPLAMAGSYAILILTVFGISEFINALWYWASELLMRRHSPPFEYGWVPIESLGGAFAISALSLAALLAAPWAVRGFVAIDRSLIRSLLGPVTLSERVRALQATRTQAVEDSAAHLRRIERDLHDGAQVRLTALAMTLGRIKESLEHGADESANMGRTRELVNVAHQNAKDALVELRDLARGIHPPALDTGLDAALATLAASSAVPVSLSVDMPRRPSPAIETIAYFCVAELLANVAKHSGAERALVQVREHHGKLYVSVSDDGSGGAYPRGGLAGLADRVRTVDGDIQIKSPTGGPTVVSVKLPMDA